METPIESLRCVLLNDVAENGGENLWVRRGRQRRLRAILCTRRRLRRAVVVLVGRRRKTWGYVDVTNSRGENIVVIGRTRRHDERVVVFDGVGGALEERRDCAVDVRPVGGYVRAVRRRRRRRERFKARRRNNATRG